LWELPIERREDLVVALLPPGKTVLPREKHCPKPRPLTKWEQYALEKGITKKKKTNVVWDDIVQVCKLIINFFMILFNLLL
jgi:regulator of ribosome biosynthesis